MLPALRVNIGHHIAPKDGDFPDMAIGVSWDLHRFGRNRGGFRAAHPSSRRDATLFCKRHLWLPPLGRSFCGSHCGRTMKARLLNPRCFLAVPHCFLLKLLSGCRLPHFWRSTCKMLKIHGGWRWFWKDITGFKVAEPKETLFVTNQYCPVVREQRSYCYPYLSIFPTKIGRSGATNWVSLFHMIVVRQNGGCQPNSLTFLNYLEVLTIMWDTQCHKSTIWGWFIMVYKFITPVKIEGLEMLYEIGFTTIMRKKTWYLMASEIANLDKVVAWHPKATKHSNGGFRKWR